MSIKNNFAGLTKNIKEKSFLSLVSAFLALIVALYLIFLPAVKQFGKLSQQIRGKKADLSRVQQPSGEYRVLNKETKEMRDKKDLLAAKLFWEKDISRFLNELTRLTSNSEVEFINIKPEASLPVPEKDKELFTKYHFARVPISVKIRGTYDGLLNFLKKVEESDKFIKIEYLNIESGVASLYKHNIDIRFSIVTKEEGAGEKV